LIEATARFVEELPGVTLVNLLPYHRTGIMKFKRLGKLCQLTGIDGPSVAEMENLSRIFNCHGLRVKIGG
jgi:pyruvate-formate lyase-activating enzyme